MTDSLSAAASPGTNMPEFSVSELSLALKHMVESEFSHVRVRGEISGFKRAASGHLYMTLKDDEAVLDAVCWRGTAGKLAIKPEDGMEVISTGRLTTYPGRSKYQIVIESMELAGQGALLKLLEERKKKLAAEGLFDAARKRKIPFLPNVIGVITSPTGAVIRDILHRLADRFPRHVLLWPVLVQGQGAAEQVAAAIAGFNRIEAGGKVPRPDLLIVARGGGSLEDLWAFNEEIVVRAAAASEIPLISAVGHETDTTLIDFASDLRAPTPTAAAEMAVPVRSKLLGEILDHQRRLVGGLGRSMDERRLRLASAARGVPDPRRVLEAATQRLDDRSERLANAVANLVTVRRHRIERASAGLNRQNLVQKIAHGGERVAQLTRRLTLNGRRLTEQAERKLASLGALLESYSYQRVLERGFALVRGGAGAPITQAAQAAPGSDVTIRFADGEVDARIAGAGPASPPAKPRPVKPKPGGDGQGSLL
ncbi:MAG: exodeoxyribonuclease VII large subunit [Alphaproteobacteria bacterium]